ncbi:MAG: hypothetical protein FWF96_01190 [Kiritimatiellaeota bacterium]|nr:hypothetical protein [Kiritimatiellota bacterium]
MGWYIIVMTGGLKVRLLLPNGFRELPQQGSGLSARSTWGAEGLQICVRGTVADGAVFAAMTDCFTSAQLVCIRCGVPYNYPRRGYLCRSCRDLVYK